MKLKNIKLYEEFTESKNFLIKKYFDELSQKIEKWFTEGSLSIDGLEFLNMDKYNTVGGMTKTLTLKFKDMQYEYCVDILIDHDMFEENELKNCYLSIKLYDQDDNLLTTDIDSDVDINNITEDYLIEKISNIKDKYEQNGENTNDNAEESQVDDNTNAQENTENEVQENTEEQ